MSRFDCATWRPVGNHGGAMSANLGLLLHHAVADGSLQYMFNNPSSGVSAHFWVGRDGTIEQYVDSEVVAWHAMQMNDTYCGVETEGCATPPHAEPMTEAMVDALARLYAEGHQRHGWPFSTAEVDGQPGFGYHRMGVATACPCDVRLAMRYEILTRAGELVDGGGAVPAPQPPGEQTGAAPPWPGRYLSYPPVMQGTDVQTWQAQMAARGWELGVDGQYGPQSQGICIAFQTEKGLMPVDGIVGPDTWAAAWTAPIT